jgi:hypothetical protein
MNQSLLITGLVLLAGSKLCVAAAPQTRWDWMLSVQAEKETSRVRYCGEHIPAMKATLDADNMRYQSLLRQVAATFADRVAALPELSKPVDPKLVEGMAEMLELRAQLLSKAPDLQKECSDVQATLLRQSYESIRQEIQSALDRVPQTPERTMSPQ